MRHRLVWPTTFQLSRRAWQVLIVCLAIGAAGQLLLSVVAPPEVYALTQALYSLSVIGIAIVLLGWLASPRGADLWRSETLYRQLLEQAGAQRQRERELDTINAIGRALAESLDLNQVCAQLTAAIGQLFPDYLALLITQYDARRQMMTLISGVDNSGPLDPAQFPPLPLEPMGYGPQSEAIHTRRVVVVNRYPERVQQARHQVTVGDMPQSVLYAPMLVKGEVVGVVQVQSPVRDRFSQNDAELLALIANTAAISIVNARLFEAEHDQRAETEALYETLVALSRTLNFDEVLDLALRHIGETVPHDAADILMIDQDVGHIVRWQGRIEPGQEAVVHSLELPIASTPSLRRLIDGGQVMIIPDVQANPDWIKTSATAWVRAHCAAPIRARGRTLGALEVYRTVPNFYTAVHAARLQARADLVGIAWQTVQLLDVEREQRALSEALYDAQAAVASTLNLDEVLDRILKNVARIVPNDAANIVVLEMDVVHSIRWLSALDPEARYQMPEVHWKVEDVPLYRQLFESHQPVMIADVRNYSGWIRVPFTPWIRSYVAAPMEKQGRVLGVLELSSSTPRFFTLQHATYLHLFAAQAAEAIENARLFEQTRRRAQELGILYESSVAISSSLDRDTILNTILQRLADAVNATSTYVIWIDWEQLCGTVIAEYFSPRASALERVSDLGETFKLTESSPLLAALRQAQPLPLTINQADLDPFTLADLKRFGGKSTLRIPMIVSDQVRGYVVVWDTQTERTWSEAEIRLCQTLVNQAAVAIFNAQLFADMQRRVVEQAALFAAASAVSSSLNFKVILQRLAEQLARAIDATSAYIAEWDQRLGTTTVLAEYVGPEAHPLERVSDLDQTYTTQAELGAQLLAGSAIVIHADDEQLARDMRDHLKQYGGKSVLLVALEAHGTIFGYAEMWESRRKRLFTLAEISLCRSIAQHAAIAFNNAQLFEAEREQHALAEALYDSALTLSSTLELDEVLARILANAGRIVPNDLAAMFQIDDQAAQATRIFGRSTPAEESALRRVRFGVKDAPNLQRLIESGEPLVMPDVRDDPGWLELPELNWIKSFVAVPILIRGRVVSLLLLYSATRRFYTPLHGERLRAFAAQAAIAIENARSFEEERKQLQLAQTLQAVGTLLTAGMSLAEVFEQIFDLLAQVVRYDSVSVHVIENGEIQLAAGRGFLDLDQIRQQIDTVVKQTLKSRWADPQQRLLIIPDTHHDPRWISLPNNPHVHSWIGAALRVKGRLLGILNVDSQIPNEYDEAIGETVAAFANQAAIAIENTQLHNAEHRYTEELERRVQQRTVELEQERKRTAAILHTAGDGIVTSDRDGHIEYMNPAMEKLTGYTLAEARGKNPRLWKSEHTPASLYEKLWSSITRGEIWRGELTNRRKDGATFEAALTIAPLHNSEGQITGYVGVQHDITHQKELERLKDEFVSNVSHELRTPIANVKLYISLLTSGKPEKYQNYLQTLRREALRLEKLIEDLLDLSRLDLNTVPLYLGPIDLNQLAAQLIADRTELAARRELVIDYHAEDVVLPGLGDSARLVQVMSNLLTNAINYTPPGGQIVVTTGLRQHEEQDWSTFTVQDSGPGISARDLPHLFERFYRGEAGRKSGAPGTGLGLAISAQIMRRMGGRITVESEPGHGATFTLWCPTI